jgi:hypothetical protein
VFPYRNPKERVVLPIRVLQWTADDLEGLMIPLFTVTQRIPPREAESVFLNVYGAQESIPRNEFRQPM